MKTVKSKFLYLLPLLLLYLLLSPLYGTPSSPANTQPSSSTTTTPATSSNTTEEFKKLKTSLSDEVNALEKEITQQKEELKKKEEFFKKQEEEIFASSKKYKDEEIKEIKDQLILKQNLLAEKKLFVQKENEKLTQEEELFTKKIASFSEEEKKELKALFTKKKSLLQEKLDLQIKLIEAEIKHLESLHAHYLKNKLITKEEIKNTARITQKIGEELTQKKKESQKVLQEAKKTEKEAQKIKEEAIEKIQSASNQIEKEYGLLLQKLAEEKLAESELQKKLVQLEQEEMEMRLQKAKLDLEILTHTAQLQKRPYTLLERIALKEKLLQKQKEIMVDMEQLKDYQLKNLEILTSLKNKLQDFREEKKKSRHYKISRTLSNIIYVIESQIEKRQKINELLASIISLKETGIRDIQQFFKNILFPPKTNLWKRSPTTYNPDEIWKFLDFYKKFFSHLPSLFLSAVSRIPPFHKTLFLNLNFLIGIVVLSIFLILRKITIKKIKNYASNLEKLHLRIWEEKDKNFQIIILQALYKSIPFFIHFTALIVITFLFRIEQQLYYSLAIAYFSIFVYYFLKYLLCAYLETKQIPHKEGILWSWKYFLLFSLLYWNLILTYKIISHHPIKTPNLIYSILLTFILSLFLKKYISKLIPETNIFLLKILKKLIIQFYFLFLIFMMGIFLLYIFGYHYLIYFILKGILLSLLILYLKNILQKKINQFLEKIPEEQKKYFPNITFPLTPLLESVKKVNVILLSLLAYFTIFFIWGGTQEILSKIYQFSALSLKLGTIEISFLNIFKFAIIIYLAYKISSFTQFIFNHQIQPYLSWDTGLTNSILTLIHYSIVILGFILGLEALGVGLEGLKWLTGFIGIGLGFGLQNIVNNFVSGIILLFERPIKVGDIIKIDDGTMGKVKKISVRSTIVETFDNIEIIVPNSDLISNKVINYTLTDSTVRRHIQIGVSYEASPSQVKEILLKTVQEHPHVFNFPPPKVYFTAYGNSSLDFDLVYWTDFSDGYQTDTDLREKIFQAFQEAGIEIPYPKRDIYIKEMPPNQSLKPKDIKEAEDQENR